MTYSNTLGPGTVLYCTILYCTVLGLTLGPGVPLVLEARAV